MKFVTILCCRALLEAQEIFGLDFDDPNEFARVAEEGLGSEEEEEVEDDDVSSWNTVHFSHCSTCLVSLGLCHEISSCCIYLNVTTIQLVTLEPNSK